MYYNWDRAYERAADFEISGKALPPSIRHQKENFGFSIYLVRQSRKNGGYTIMTGCRFFTPDEAKAHWSKRQHFGQHDPYFRLYVEKVRKRAVSMLALLPKLRRRAKSYGWI